MSIHVALNHVTHYRYDRLVALGPQIVRLRPAPHCRTRILSYSLKVTPAKHFINWQQDPEANYLGRFVFPEKTGELRIEVDLVAEMAVLNPFDFFLEPHAETFPFGYEGAEKRDLAPYLVMFRGEPLFKDYLGSIPRERKRTIDFLVELNLKLSRDIKYLIRMEPGVQTPELTLREGFRFVPRLLVAAGAAAAAHGTRGALRFGLSHPAHARHEIARRPVGAGAGISPTCMPGARSIFPARAGSDSIRPPGCWPARGTFRWPARPSPSVPRRSPARWKRPR